MSAVLLLFVCATSPRALSGTQAIEKTRAILKAFGEPAPFRLQGLGAQDIGGTPRWDVKLSGPRGVTYEGWLGGPEGELNLWRGKEGDAIGLGPAHPLTDPSENKRVQDWLSKIGARAPNRLQSLTASKDNHQANAEVAILRNGYPFVSYPHYGYSIVFTLPDHRFLALRGMEIPPEVDGIPPRLDEKAALDALQRIWDTEIGGPAVRNNHWKRNWFRLTGKPELGYYLQKGHPKANLAWRFTFMNMRDVGYAIQGGSDAMLIDAVTGRRIRTEMVP